MRREDAVGRYGLWLGRTLLIMLLIRTPLLLSQQNSSRANVLLWDTQVPLADETAIGKRADWKAVPANLLTLEANPAKAISDPSYSGRVYEFKGDAAVENEYFTAVFLSGSGKVIIISKNAGKKLIEITPLQLKTKQAKISTCRIWQNTGDAVTLAVTFTDRQMTEAPSIAFSFRMDRIVDINPQKYVKGISIISPVAYGIIPDFIGDDLIFTPSRYSSLDSILVPSDNLFLGLLQGEAGLLMVTWPEKGRQTRLVLEKNKGQTKVFNSIHFNNDGESIYVGLLEAPGIWHKEDLKATYLEKDTKIPWRKPFSAKWITQLSEADVKTTYRFRAAKGTIWRGIIGSYIYPVWFDGDQAFFHFSKKIPPKGEAIIYFLERKNTPAAMSAPVDIIRNTLGRQKCAAIVDIPGRVLRTHHRRGSAGIRRACTCGCTEAIRKVFQAGREVEKKDYIAGAVDDMLYFVNRHVARIKEYMIFADDMLAFLKQARKNHNNNTKLVSFLDKMEQITRQIPQEYSVQAENMKTLEYADQLARQTNSLSQKKRPGNYSAWKELDIKWRKMGGSQDYIVARFHNICRQLFQEAGYGCVNQPVAIAIAHTIRMRCRKCLRNPDSYEIWVDY